MIDTLLPKRQSTVPTKKVPKVKSGYQLTKKFIHAAEVIIAKHTSRFSWLWSRSLDPEIEGLDRLVSAVLQTYQDFYENGLHVVQENWTESNCLNVFQSIACEVLNSEEEHETPELRCNWSRIAMLLAVACKMAQHLYRNGASNKFVKNFTRAVGNCLAENVIACGGLEESWANLRSTDSQFFNIFGVGTALLGFVWTVATLAQPADLLINFLKP